MTGDPRSRGLGRRRFLGLTAAGAAGIIAGCAPTATTTPSQTPTAKASETPAPPDQTAFTVGYLPGTIALPIGIMQSLDLAKKYNLGVTYKQFGDSNALNDAYLLKQIQLHPGMDTAQAAIKKLQSGYGQAVFPTFRATNKIVVKADSPVKSIADLKGRKMAVINQTSEWFVLKKWLKSDHGIDLTKDVDTRAVPPPVALQLFDQGDVAAVMIFEPWASRAQFGGKGRVLIDIQQEWQKRNNGETLWFSAICADDEFAKAHPTVVKRYLQAYVEAVQYIGTNPDSAFGQYKQSFNITSDADYQLLVKNMTGIFPTKWDDAVIASLKKFLQLVVEEGQLKSIPNELFTTAYAP